MPSELEDSIADDFNPFAKIAATQLSALQHLACLQRLFSQSRLTAFPGSHVEVSIEITQALSKGIDVRGIATHNTIAEAFNRALLRTAIPSDKQQRENCEVQCTRPKSESLHL